MIRKIDISHKTIIFITAFLLGLWILYLIVDILLLLFVAFIFMSTLAPIVDKLESIRVPRVLAVALVFVLALTIFLGLATIGVRPLVSQTANLSQRLADTVGTLTQFNLIDQSLLNEQLTNISRQVINFTFHAFENLIALLSLFVITFYLLLDRHKFEDHVSSLFVNRKDKINKLIIRIEDKLGAWLRGQLLLSLAVGVTVYISLTILGIEFALPLAILAGLLEVVPVIGPIIAAIPAVLLALTISPVTGALVAGVYLAIQQLENQILVPQIMRKAVGLNPLLVIISITIGGRLLGIGGALLAVPIAVVMQLIAQEVVNDRV